MKVFIVVTWMLILTSTVFCQTELLLNGGFDTNLSNWQISGTPGSVAWSNHFNNGTAAFSENNIAPDGVISQNFSASPGEELSISLHYGKLGSGATEVKMLVEIIDLSSSHPTIILSEEISTTGDWLSSTFFLTVSSSDLIVRLSDQTNVSNQRDFHLNTISIKQGTALPIELSNFQAQPISNERVHLNWTTEMERNNDYFSIERALNGSNDWEEIATVPGQGNSDFRTTYEYLDEQPYFQVSYYRIKQTDFDGTTTYSSIQSVFVDNGKIKIFPNPASTEISILNLDVEGDQLLVTDILGKVVNSFIEINSLDKSNYQIELSNLPTGFYFIKTKHSSFKFFKN